MKEEVQQQKKKFFPLNDPLRDYLKDYKRQLDLPVHYENLLQAEDSFPVVNAKNEDTLWQTMVYDQNYGREIFEGL